MNRTNFIKALKMLGACQPAMDWVRETPGTPAELYGQCANGDWLEWLADESKVALDQEDLDRRLTPFWAEFERKVNAIQADYNYQWDQHRANFNSNPDASLFAFECAATKRANECLEKEAQCWRHYNLQRADVIRSMVPFSAIEAGLSKT